VKSGQQQQQPAGDHNDDDDDDDDESDGCRLTPRQRGQESTVIQRIDRAGTTPGMRTTDT